MTHLKRTAGNHRQKTSAATVIGVCLAVCFGVISGPRDGLAQRGDFLKTEPAPAQKTTASTGMTPTVPAATVAPSSQNFLPDDWYRFETATLAPMLSPLKQRYLDGLTELGLTDLVTFECRKRIAADSLDAMQKAGYTRALLQAEKQELCNAPPQNRSLVWERIERCCAESEPLFADTPFAAAVLLQRINARLAYTGLLINDADATNDVSPQAAELLDAAIADIDAELERVSQRIARQPASPTTSRETTAQMTLAQLLRFRKAVALRLLARCRPDQNDESLSQALAILRPMLAAGTPTDTQPPGDFRQGTLSTFAAFEAIACYRMSQQYDEAVALADRLRSADLLTPHQRAELAAVDLQLAVDRRDEARVHAALQAVDAALPPLPGTLPANSPAMTPQQLAVAGVPDLLFAKMRAYLFFWKRNIETQSSVPQIVGTTTASNLVECRRQVLEITQRLERDCASYWHRRAELLMTAESRFFGNDPVFVEQRADALVREGQIDEAVDRYDRLAAATAASDSAESFRFAKKAAELLADAADRQWQRLVASLDESTSPDAQNVTPPDMASRLSPEIWRQTKSREQAVIDRYRTLAVSHPKYVDAIEAHLAALYHAARLLQAGDESGLNDYLSLLREHYRTWPHSKQADPLRLQEAQLLIHESKFRDALETLAPVTNRSPLALDIINAADQCFDRLRLETPDVKATVENEAVAWFYRRLLNTDNAVVADWNDADARCLLCTAKYGLLYANVIERNRAANPGVNLPAAYQSVEKMLRIGLANYKQASPEWRAAVDSMLLYLFAAQGKINDASQILQHMRQWDLDALMTAFERLQRLADISPAANRRPLGEMRLEIAQVIEQKQQTNSDAMIDRQKLDVIRADALADTGKAQEAVDLLGQLLRKSPGDVTLLKPLAQILERQSDVPSREMSLKIWRSVEQHSSARSESWWDAKEAILRLLIALGRRQEAESAFQMLKILNPELGGPDRKLRIETIIL